VSPPANSPRVVLGQDDRSGFFQLFRDNGVSVGVVVPKEDRAQRGRHPLGVHLILEDHRNAVKWTDKAAHFE
jgi:hypothetical protein